MTTYTEAGMQELANERRKAVCGWVPCCDRGGTVPVSTWRPGRWIYEPGASVREYEKMPAGNYAQRKVWRPQ